MSSDYWCGIVIVMHIPDDCVHSRKGRKHSLKILQRFHFSSALKRMSTVCSLLGGAQHIGVVKGAAEVIRPMVKYAFSIITILQTVY